MNSPAPPSEDDFRRLYERTSPRVYGYVRRRCRDSDCDDIIAEAYLAAWRHFDRLPVDPVPWLLRAARNAFSNHRRGRARQERLAEEVQSLHQVAGPDCAQQAIEQADLLDALPYLSENGGEVLLLTGWDSLDAAGVATVLSITPTAARARLSRARRRLQTPLRTRSARPPSRPRDREVLTCRPRRTPTTCSPRSNPCAPIPTGRPAPGTSDATKPPSARS